MPDKAKLEVFSRTNMVLFKSCVLCKHGEVPPTSAWGFCKHPEHFYTHGRHGRLPGTSHASMGCDDFTLKHTALRQMAELGPYLELVPFSDTMVEPPPVVDPPKPQEDIDENDKKLLALIKKSASEEFIQRLQDSDSEALDLHIEIGLNKPAPTVEMHFNGEPVDDAPAPKPKPEAKPEENDPTALEELGTADTKPEVEEEPKTKASSRSKKAAQSSAQSSAQSTKKSTKRSTKRSSKKKPVEKVVDKAVETIFEGSPTDSSTPQEVSP